MTFFSVKNIIKKNITLWLGVSDPTDPTDRQASTREIPFPRVYYL